MAGVENAEDLSRTLCLLVALTSPQPVSTTTAVGLEVEGVTRSWAMYHHLPGMGVLVHGLEQWQAPPTSLPVGLGYQWVPRGRGFQEFHSTSRYTGAVGVELQSHVWVVTGTVRTFTVSTPVPVIP